MRPERVQIGAIWYTVTDKPEDGNYGDTDFGALEIAVSGAFPEQRQRETLVHEVCHAILDRYLGDQLDERALRQLAIGLYDWMVSNPDAVRWVTGG